MAIFLGFLVKISVADDMIAKMKIGMKIPSFLKLVFHTFIVLFRFTELRCSAGHSTPLFILSLSSSDRLALSKHRCANCHIVGTKLVIS